MKIQFSLHLHCSGGSFEVVDNDKYSPDSHVFNSNVSCVSDVEILPRFVAFLITV